MIQRRATYRVQLRAEHGFDDVAAITDYLDALGVSHLHASPILQAAPGSTHGYDVVAHDRVSRELGGADAHARLLAALRARGLGWILDIVPNHMAIGTRENAWWWDVLENGPTSRYARTFDVEWRRGDDDRIVLPILGARYADALEGKQIAIVRDGTAFEARYGDHRLPLAPQSIGAPLGAVAAAVGGAAGERLAFVADGLAALPLVTEDRDAAARRHRDKEVLTAILRELIDGDAALARAIDGELAAISADPVRLDAMLERQNWRLFHWSAASSDISYRRFFDVASLAGLRTEDPHVALDTHRAILRWLDDGTLDGVRIDHVDGLRDPTAYLQWLRRRAPRAWIVVEKILAAGEALPEAWPIDGTTGYDAMRTLDHAFVDPSAERALEDVWLANGGEPTAWSPQSRAARREVIELMFGHERDRLVELACSAARARMELRDVTRRELSAAVT
ncbi:MAG TPA: alpha-amylase family glycosyl hydrolase, partial [Kofleriaceae bacterium]|nr:alpha-amylase family glycosyl hydrolase [Kofleriaceae bacterium]